MSASAKAPVSSTKSKRDVEKALLTTNLVAGLAVAAPYVLAPNKWHNTFFGEGQPHNRDMNNFWVLGMVSCGTFGQMVANSDDKKLKKNALKLCGAAWMTAAAMQANNVRRGTQKKELGLAAGGFQAAMASTFLWAGFRKD
ncbi:hypothetical protein HYH03_012058 [Edaphochlamys debaryana]|uniref:Uncharacterized protein n=1 Tax=Edaphochlamys debaryana TaxID=47281 RepID=A0A835XTI9_9CHLO|nr:hypothetical protein HYH03_012058 [Edaphochlamys debaryana]|eukprot:KAG2489420.1 hypothetical protein HYH03_012058 [Edaphochlamys debaryana]